MTEALEMDSLFGKDRADALVEALWKHPAWPRDPVRDRALVVQLIDEFPSMDLAEEFSKWRTWMIGKGNERMMRNNGRFSRVRNWCRNAADYRRSGPGGFGAHSAAGGGRRPASSAAFNVPAPQSAFGNGTRLVDWT